MRNRLLKSMFAITAVSMFMAAMLAVAQQPRQKTSAPQAADLTLKQRMSMQGQNFESTTMFKGARQRSEMHMMGMNMTSITQCDLKRTVQLGEQTKKYMVSPMAQDASTDDAGGVGSSTSQTSEPNRRGGIVTYTMTTTDTGERKDMFGFKARHIKTSMVMEPSANACQREKMRIDTDGWYIDFEIPNCALNAPTQMMRPGRSGGCQDQIRFKYAGGGRPGYPLNMTTTMFKPDGSVQMTMTTEVLELSRATLDPALFDVPAGFAETKNAQDLYDMSAMMSAGMGRRPSTTNVTSESSIASADGSPSAKSPGTIRVGVVAINNKTDKTVSVLSLRDQLIGNLSGSNLDAVPLDASSPDAVEAEAKQKQCDFILYTDITALKQASATRKMGGLLGRATGIGSAGVDKSESRVDYRLMAVGSTSPQLQSSAIAKEEGDEASVAAALVQEAQKVSAQAQKRRR